MINARDRIINGRSRITRISYKSIVLLTAWIIGISVSRAAPAQAAERESREERRYQSDLFYNNKGYLYYNPSVPEGAMRPETVEYAPLRTAPYIPPRQKPQPIEVQKTIPKPLQRMSYEKTGYIKELEDRLMREQERSLQFEEELDALQEKLDRVTQQLSTATQKIISQQKTQSAEPAARKITQTYQVKKGDSLWSIAKKSEIYGNPDKWLLLYHANRDQIYDPNLIFPDMVLLVPRVDEYASSQ